MKQRITNVFQGLKALKKEKDVQDHLPDWIVLGTKASEAEYQEGLADRLTELACQDSFVAQGVIASSRLKAVGSSHLPRVAQQLLDAAEGRSADCDGAKGLNDAEIIEQLRKWAKNKTKQTSQ